jgi:hypothetical protein
MNKIRIWLSHPSVPFIAVILAVGLTLPSLWNGFALDDHIHRNILLSDTPMSVRFMSALNLFCFVSEENSWRFEAGKKLGSVPWWSPDDSKVCFFRPVTSITHWFDYQFWPNTPTLMHLQSLTWFGMLVFFVSLLYRRILGVKWVAGLAALFFAVDPAHGIPAGWLANRNVLIAGVFGALCLIVHDQWKQKGWRFGFLLGPLCFALALLSKEAGIAIGAYLLSYTLFLEQGSIRKRLIHFIPYALVFLSWSVTYVLLDCGTSNFAVYTDPLNEPLLYLKAIFLRAPVYLLGQWILPVGLHYAIWPSIIHRAGLIFSVLLIFILFPLIRKDRTAQFWTLRMFLSLLPICAVLPGDRNLLFVGLGAMGLLAQWIYWMVHTGWKVPSLPLRVFTRIMVVIFILIHLLIHPILLPRSSRGMAVMDEKIKRASASLPPGSETEAWMFILTNNPLYMFFVSSVQREIMNQGGQFTPFLALSSGNHSVTYTRKDVYTINVQSANGSLTDLDNRPLGKEYAMQPGQIVRLNNVVVEVLEVSNGLPSRVQFRFRFPLDDPGFLWFRWEKGIYVPFSPPDVGEAVTIEGARFPRG